MKGLIAGALAIVVASAGCRSAEVTTMESIPAPALPPANASYLPAGTDLVVELTQTLSTDDSRVGDRFTATVKEPLVARNGEIVVPRGAVVTGVVTGLDPSDRIGDQAAIRLAFESLTIGNQVYPLRAAIVETDVDVSTNGLGDVAQEAGIGAAAGAALGAILGGDLSDILSGAILGAGAGTIISLGTGDVDAALPRGSDLTIRTTGQIAMR